MLQLQAVKEYSRDLMTSCQQLLSQRCHLYQVALSTSGVDKQDVQNIERKANIVQQSLILLLSFVSFWPVAT